MSRQPFPQRPGAAVAAAALLAWSGIVHGASIRLPDCPTLEALAAGVDSEQRVPINRWVEVSERSTGLTLVAGVAGAEFENAFGKTMLEFEQADYQALNPVISECIRSATRDKRMAEQRQLVELRRVINFHIGQPGNAVRRARETVAAQLEALEAVPDSVDKLALYALLVRLPEYDRRTAAGEIRAPIEQMRVDGVLPARLVAAHIQSLPQTEADGYFERIRSGRDALVESVTGELRQRIDATDDDVPGLATLNEVEQAARDLTELVPPERVQALTDAAAARRQTIWKALETRFGDAEDTEASATLERLVAAPAYRTLSADDRQRLDTLVSRHRQARAAATAGAAAEELNGFPRTLDGLQQMVAFARERRSQLARQFAPEARQAFENAYHQAHSSRVEAVQAEFDQTLAALPENRDSLRRINELLEAVDAPARSGLYLAGLSRGRQIATAVQRAERRSQCARALPELELEADDAALPVLGLADGVTPLGELLCDVALAGNRVHGYEGPGFFDDDHVLEITGRDGIFRTYTLHTATVGPDQEALVGVSVADPTSETPLTVAAWRDALAGLLPDSPAGRDARCTALMNKPEAELTTADRMAAVSCLMGSLLKP